MVDDIILFLAQGSNDVQEVKAMDADGVKAALGQKDQFEEILDGFLSWARDERELAEPTCNLYAHCLRRYLRFFKYNCKEPTAWAVWNLKQARLFFRFMRDVVKTPATSMINYHSALTSARLFMQLKGKKPANYLDLLASFEIYAANENRRRRVHIEKRKDELTDGSSVLKSFYLRAYHNEEEWAEWHRLISFLKSPPILPFRLTPVELSRANGLMLACVIAPNMMRASNCALIENKVAVKALKEAYVKFKAENPDVSINEAERRLDRTQCCPAVFHVAESAKKGGKEGFAILRPRDQLALLNYSKYIRKFAPSPVKTTKFFFNSKGEGFGRFILSSLKALSKRAKIKGLTFNMLRSAVETENALRSDSHQSSVTSHLSHSRKVADKYYVIRDERHVVQGSHEILRLLEDIGESEDTAMPAGTKSLADVRFK